MPSRNIDKLRDFSGFLPGNIRLSMVNYATIGKQDAFYGLCQKHRDYYKDVTTHILPVQYFDIPQRRNGDPPNPTSAFIKQPMRYHVEMRPCNYPLTSARSGGAQDRGPAINMRGTHSACPCRAYKR